MRTAKNDNCNQTAKSEKLTNVAPAVASQIRTLKNENSNQTCELCKMRTVQNENCTK